MAESPQPFPWDAVMAFGLGTLKLSPKDFWGLSVRELQAAMTPYQENETKTISRQWLDSAMGRFPDSSDDE